MDEFSNRDRPLLQSVTKWNDGLTWITDPDERAQRASHALQTAGGVWLVDPVDATGLDEQVTASGDVVGVLVLHDRHTRDASIISRRHDVPVFLPNWMTLTTEKLEASPEFIEDQVPGTAYTIHQLIDAGNWEEAILVNETTNTIVIPEAVGIISSFRDGENTLGVHPSLTEPPQRLRDWEPDRILVGHGSSIHQEASASLEAALDAM